MRKRVWLIDDEQDMLLLLADIFQDRYSIEAFQSADALFARFGHGEMPNVVISDFKMPGINGLQLVQKLREMHCTAPVIIISGYVNKEISLDALNIHVFKILEKPFSNRELSSSVAQAVALDHSREVNHELKRSAEEFLDVAFEAMRVYKERAEDAERVLRDLGLIASPVETQLQRVLKAGELQSRAADLQEKITALESNEHLLNDHLKAI